MKKISNGPWSGVKSWTIQNHQQYFQECRRKRTIKQQQEQNYQEHQEIQLNHYHRSTVTTILKTQPPTPAPSPTPKTTVTGRNVHHHLLYHCHQTYFLILLSIIIIVQLLLVNETYATAVLPTNRSILRIVPGGGGGVGGGGGGLGGVTQLIVTSGTTTMGGVNFGVGQKSTIDTSINIVQYDKESVESSLQTIHDIATENLGSLCVSKSYRPLQIALNTDRYDGSREKADLAAVVLQEVGINRHGGLLDALTKGLLSDMHITSARILATNTTNGVLVTSVWWVKNVGGLNGPHRIEEDGVQMGMKPNPNYPWFEDEDSTPGLRSPKFVPSPENVSFRGWWTYPYYSCTQRRWILSYSIAIPPIGRHGMRGFLSIDIDLSDLQVNQCSVPTHLYEYEMVRNGKAINFDDAFNQIDAFHESHKCHISSMQCDYRPVATTTTTITTLSGTGKSSTVVNGWTRGAYQCLCKPGFYSLRHPNGFNGTIMEVAYQEYRDNISTYYEDVFKCQACAPGCDYCVNARPCLATYNWAFRMSLLTFSVLCAIFTITLACYMYRHRKVKVFKVASPIFLTITLLGCAIMYLEMAAIFPILDVYSCIVTKWTRHMGFCITYTALLMKTWRVSLTYRVKSAHKVKLTDKQLLQWMVPILLVMLIYLGTWTLSATPSAEVIMDKHELKFKQCSYNWWDHSLAIGEVLFLAWGIRVCYNVRNAESLYNEARMISYAIYNIALVNIAMIAFHLFIFPQAGPDIKYLLGFIRTQLSTSVTIALVFGPKVVRVLRGQGDQWDNRARVRGITASFSLNGTGLVPEDSPDLYQENEELKEEVQKLAAQIEFMKIVHMEINNRHIKPKPGGYFTLISAFQSPMGKPITAQTQTSKHSTQQNSGVSEDGHSGTNSVGANSIGRYPTMHGGGHNQQQQQPPQPQHNSTVNGLTEKV